MAMAVNVEMVIWLINRLIRRKITERREVRWRAETSVLSNLILLIDGSKFTFKSCIYLWCVQCHLVGLTLDTPKMDANS